MYAQYGLFGRALQTKCVLVYKYRSSLSRVGGMLLGTRAAAPSSLSDSTVLAPGIAEAGSNSLPSPLLVFTQSKDHKNKRIYGCAQELSTPSGFICRDRILGMSLLHMRSMPIKKYSRCGPYSLNQHVS